MYPARKYKESTDAEDESAWASLKILTDNYSSIEPRLRRTFDNSLFAYYTAKELLAQFPTVASVALIAALKPFRATGKCPGAVTCSLCGNLGFRHDNTGEAASISATLGNNFGFAEDDGRRTEMREMIKHFYRTQRSS